MSTWADLDKVSVAKPRSDGRATLVVRDDRSVDAMNEVRPLSMLMAFCRVIRAKQVIGDKYQGHGVVIYSTATAPPSFLVDAVSAAGGTVFDGTRERTSGSPQSATLLLDSAFFDLATVVRRRFKVGSFADALEMLERQLRMRPPSSTDPASRWTAVFELAAVTGEVLRVDRGGKWIEVPADRFPVALDRGNREVVFPGKLALAMVDGGAGSMLSLVRAAQLTDEPPRPATLQTPQTFLRPMPLLVDRRSVPIERLTWKKLVKDEVDSPDMPVIAYVDDRDDVIGWPLDKGPPSEALERLALQNLAGQPTEVTQLDIPHGKLAVVTGGFFAAEALLDRAVMERVRSELGGPRLVLVGVPARGQLLAIDAERATVDSDFQNAFLMMVEREYLRADERNRITSEVIVYMNGPLGRVQSNLMDARRTLRGIGVDPDAPDAEDDSESS